MLRKKYYFFLLVYLFFPLYFLPEILSKGRPLDLHLYYTPTQAYTLIASYGVETALHILRDSSLLIRSTHFFIHFL
jgi:hypothetical protein